MQFEPLLRAIAQQYEAFVSPQPRNVDGCQCCTSPRELAALLAVPRESLSAPALDFYARKAMTTVGGQSDFRYFWPRIAELSIAGDLLTDREVVFGKPRYGEDQTWPTVEQTALVDLARALGQWLGAESFESSEVSEWVCSIGLLVEGLTDIRPLLSPLLESTSTGSANLMAFVAWNRPDIEKKHRLANAFWSSAPQSAAAVLEWYFSESRVQDAIYAIDLESAQLYGTPMPVRRHTGS